VRQAGQPQVGKVAGRGAWGRQRVKAKEAVRRVRAAGNRGAVWCACVTVYDDVRRYARLRMSCQRYNATRPLARGTGRRESALRRSSPKPSPRRRTEMPAHHASPRLCRHGGVFCIRLCKARCRRYAAAKRAEGLEEGQRMIEPEWPVTRQRSRQCGVRDDTVNNNAYIRARYAHRR